MRLFFGLMFLFGALLLFLDVSRRRISGLHGNGPAGIVLMLTAIIGFVCVSVAS